MKTKLLKLVEVDVRSVRIVVEVRYGDEDMPYDFPFRTDDEWQVTIDIDSGKIKDWPRGVSHDLHMKVCDCGSYYLLDERGETVASIEGNYVPNMLIPGSYGDYIEMKIDEDGTITNWPKNPKFAEFRKEVDSDED